MKKISMLLLAMFVLILGACAGNDSGADSGAEAAAGDETELTVWAWDTLFNVRAMELALEAFEESNPDADISLNIEESGLGDVVQRMLVSLGAGTTNELPNIVLIEDYRAHGFLNNFPDMFYDITDYLDTTDFAPHKISATSVDGRQFGVPWDSGVTGLYVRTDILEEAGFTVEDITNVDWNKIIDVAVEVREVTGLPLITLNPQDLGIVRSMLLSTGSWYTKEDGETPNLEGNENLKAVFEVYRRMVEEGITMPITDGSENPPAIHNGDVWAATSGNWITPTIMSEESQSGDWAVVPQPRVPGVEGAANASNWGGSSWYILNIDGKEAAAELLVSTFGSDKDFYQTVLEEIGAIGTFLPAAGGEAYQMEVEFFGGQQIFSDFTEWSADIPEVNIGMHTMTVEHVLVEAMQAFLGGQDIEQVLANAQAQAELEIN